MGTHEVLRELDLSRRWEACQWMLVKINYGASVVSPDSTFSWSISTISNVVVARLLLCSKDNSATVTGLI